MVYDAKRKPENRTQEQRALIAELHLTSLTEARGHLDKAAERLKSIRWASTSAEVDAHTALGQAYALLARACAKAPGERF